jgi:hypothetical protein
MSLDLVFLLALPDFCGRKFWIALKTSLIQNLTPLADQLGAAHFV